VGVGVGVALSVGVESVSGRCLARCVDVDTATSLPAYNIADYSIDG